MAYQCHAARGFLAEIRGESFGLCIATRNSPNESFAIMSPKAADVFRTWSPLFERHLYACRSPRMFLRAPELADANALYDATQNPLFNAHLTWKASPDVEELRARWNRLILRTTAGEQATFSAVCSQSGRWVGALHIRPESCVEDPAWLQLGLWVHPEFWSTGYAGELHDLGVRLVFEATDASVVSALTAKDNIKAQHNLTRRGMRLVQEGPICFEYKPAEAGLLYAITRPEWAATREGGV